jgi:hypothetical protein
MRDQGGQMSHAVFNQISVSPYCRDSPDCRGKVCHTALEYTPGKLTLSMSAATP